ncbi:MAG: amidase [Proteobacteria bacterium]|nr:amidase [Pseudomonadota bacterium]
MRQDEYQQHDAVGLAELVRKREVSADELLDAAVARLDRVNDTLNVVIDRFEGEARQAIRDGLPDGPLKGVPFLVKDIGVWMKGHPTAAGSRLLKQSPPVQADSALIAAYRRAGLVLFGKTNTPEFGAAAVTESPAFGIARNPWALDRTCGGSSGGSASAVAAGVVPAAHGNDGGGSIRIPASCCGLFGLKPSRGRVSPAPLGDSWNGFAINHALTRTVRDSAALLDASCQTVSGDNNFLPPPLTLFVQEVGRDPGRLRVGFVPEMLMSAAPMDPEVSAALADAARLCASLGHEVEETKIEADFFGVRTKANAILSANMAQMLKVFGDARGRPVTEDEVESVVWIVSQDGLALSGMEMAEAFGAVYQFNRAIGAMFDRYDVLLMATLGQMPVKVGDLSITSITDKDAYTEALYRFIPNTQPFNISGATAMSVPLGWSKNGLPIGIQFVARNGNEALLLRLAGQLELARPWAERRPDERAFAS